MASFGSKYVLIQRLLTPLVQFDALPENHSLVVIIGYYLLAGASYSPPISPSEKNWNLEFWNCHIKVQ